MGAQAFEISRQERGERAHDVHGERMYEAVALKQLCISLLAVYFHISVCVNYWCK